MTKGLATAIPIALTAEAVERAQRAAVSAEDAAAAKMSTRAAHAPPTTAKKPSCGALRAGKLPPPKAEGESAGWSSSAISRHRNSPGRAKGQHTAATRMKPQARSTRRLAFTVAAHVHIGSTEQ